MKSDKLLRILTLIIFVLIGLTIIFFFSEQDGVISHNFSKTVASNIANDWNTVFSQNMNEEQLAFLTKTLDAPIRKMAHVIEYAFLGFLAFAGLRYVDGKKVKRIGIFILIFLIIGTATVDEVNQYYSGGRGASVRDVIIDTISGILGMYLFVILSDFIRRVRLAVIHIKNPDYEEEIAVEKEED